MAIPTVSGAFFKSEIISSMLVGEEVSDDVELTVVVASDGAGLPSQVDAAVDMFDGTDAASEMYIAIELATGLAAGATGGVFSFVCGAEGETTGWLAEGSGTLGGETLDGESLDGGT